MTEHRLAVTAAVAKAVSALPDEMTGAEILAVLATILDKYGITDEQRIMALLCLMETAANVTVVNMNDDDRESVH
jgi:hypothetical protein